MTKVTGGRSAVAVLTDANPRQGYKLAHEVNRNAGKWFGNLRPGACGTLLLVKVGFLALAQAHQHLHWLPAALELARRPGVKVDVLCPSRAGLGFIRSFDPKRSLRLIWTPASWRDGLFELPPRKRVHKRYGWLFRRYPILVTTESTSVRLRRDPRFKSKLIRIRHGVGDAATRIDDQRIRHFDLSLVGGEKDKSRLIASGLATEENCMVTGYAKFELVGPPPRIFADDRPIALYNPHSRPDLSSWFTQGAAMVRAMERMEGWNFVVAPHVKLEGGPEIVSTSPQILIDRGSVRSIDMSYTQAASVYIGDSSSQVYEFLVQPRPCIFINTHRVDWRDNEQYAHFELGQVIEDPEELPQALARAEALQTKFEPAQRRAMAASIARSPIPASRRQADAILEFARTGNRRLAPTSTPVTAARHAYQPQEEVYLRSRAEDGRNQPPAGAPDGRV